MKALRIVEPGRTDMVDVPEPHPGPGEVRVRVAHPRIPGHDIGGVL